MFVIIVIIPFATFPIRIHLFFLAETIAHFFETTTCTGRGRVVSGNRSARTKPSCSSAEKLNRFDFNRTSGSGLNPSIPEFRAAGDKAELPVWGL
ncbi:hypothetical protein AFLA_002222 [Aspergillus flavus NRRL3357]|nr:hypothetical protein AFLA_002222 [Aspergillus flavus NRRL3357]